jgi:hypothetical protein
MIAHGGSYCPCMPTTIGGRPPRGGEIHPVPERDGAEVAGAARRLPEAARGAGIGLSAEWAAAGEGRGSGCPVRAGGRGAVPEQVRAAAPPAGWRCVSPQGAATRSGDGAGMLPATGCAVPQDRGGQLRESSGAEGRWRGGTRPRVAGKRARGHGVPPVPGSRHRGPAPPPRLGQEPEGAAGSMALAGMAPDDGQSAGAAKPRRSHGARGAAHAVQGLGRDRACGSGPVPVWAFAGPGG